VAASNSVEDADIASTAAADAAATGQGAEAAQQAALAAGASESVANIAGSGSADGVRAAQELGPAPTFGPQPGPEPEGNLTS
jgi:flagellar biosynthesis/type III secretory pathway protein FliH